MGLAHYEKYVDHGPSGSYKKIKNDTSRTLNTDLVFKKAVEEGMLVRVLSAIEWATKESVHPTLYRQGMNVLAAGFLYACEGEVQAFALLEQFVRLDCPTYFKPNLDGVHSGLKVWKIRTCP